MASTDYVKTKDLTVVSTASNISDNDRLVASKTDSSSGTVGISVGALKQKIVTSPDNDSRIATISRVAATETTMGMVIVGNGLTVTNGVISVTPDHVALTKTLTAGETSITFTHDYISSTCDIDIYTNIFGVNPKDASVSDHTLTITFPAQANDMYVKVRVWQ